MGTYLVTGAASGIGLATCLRLERGGHQTIRVDLTQGDIKADLGTPQGRAFLALEAERLAPNGLDGVLAGAGISAPDRAAQTMAINYFGAVATLEGLRPLLTRGVPGRAVAICSTAALLPSDPATLDACHIGDEDAALSASQAQPELAYMSSKRALSHWVRRRAVSPDWGGSGVLLNGVAPGVVETAMTAPLFGDPAMLALIAQTNPMAVEGFAQADEIAEVIAFLLTLEGHYLVGQIVFVDGGTDAIMRPDAI